MSNIHIELLDNGAISITSDSPVIIKPLEDSEPVTDSAMQHWQNDMETIWISS